MVTMKQQKWKAKAVCEWMQGGGLNCDSPMIIELAQHGVEGGPILRLQLPGLLHDGVDLWGAALRGLHAIAALHVHHNVCQRLQTPTEAEVRLLQACTSLTWPKIPSGLTVT